MGVNLAALIRRHKPEQRLRPLSYRPRADLPAFADLDVRPRRELLLDTNIYIQIAAEKLPAPHQDKLERSLQHHCTVCLGEIAVGLANRDVTAATWPSERKFWQTLFNALPRNRTHVPDADTWSAAGIVAGTLARLQGFQPHQRKDALNDALIYLTAIKQGIPVLTDNHTDFDLLQQLVPSGRFYLI
jgi:predicted nucleic acid-binding protein